MYFISVFIILYFFDYCLLVVVLMSILLSDKLNFFFLFYFLASRCMRLILHDISYSSHIVGKQKEPSVKIPIKFLKFSIEFLRHCVFCCRTQRHILPHYQNEEMKILNISLYWESSPQPSHLHCHNNAYVPQLLQ